jgi:hypothetical protein
MLVENDAARASRHQVLATLAPACAASPDSDRILPLDEVVGVLDCRRDRPERHRRLRDQGAHQRATNSTTRPQHLHRLRPCMPPVNCFPLNMQQDLERDPVPAHRRVERRAHRPA